MDKTLILYYSLEENTEKIASHLAKELNVDIERITPVKDIKTKGFSKYLTGGFQASFKIKPKLNPIQKNLDQYSNVIIGTPVWAGTMSPSIYSLLEKGLIKDKNIAFFYTFKGGDKKTRDIIRKSVTKYNKLISIHSCLSVDQDLDNQKDKALNWAKDLLNDNK
jgi:flavodoxin